jgi:hypothetical protein
MRALLMRALLLPLLLGSALAPRAQTLSLDALPRYVAPPAERGPVVPAQCNAGAMRPSSSSMATAMPRDPVRAASLYCRAARFGDAEAQFSLAWMLTNSRGIERDDAQAAHSLPPRPSRAMNRRRHAAAPGHAAGAPPPCLRPPDGEEPPAPPKAGAAEAQARGPALAAAARAHARADRPLRQAGGAGLQAAAGTGAGGDGQESNFNPLPLSPKNAQGLMQLIPTRRAASACAMPDPAQNIRGGMAYLRWLLAYFEGDLRLVLAAYNAGEGAVERYRGVPPYAETRDYVRRITASLGYRYRHPFDAAAAEPSPALALIRGPGRWQ